MSWPAGARSKNPARRSLYCAIRSKAIILAGLIVQYVSQINWLLNRTKPSVARRPDNKKRAGRVQEEHVLQNIASVFQGLS
jgi:hypothetical protein